jgi:integrase/recombinase XerD
VTQLRQRMLEELQRRNYSQATTRSYILAVKQFAEYFGQSPEKLGAEEIRRYQLHLLNEKKVSAGTFKIRMSALRFLYKKTLKRRDLPFDDLVYPKRPKKLPIVLSPEEVARLIEGALHPMHRTILMVLYGTGMHRTEASLLKVSDIDSQRMVIHIRQGKGSQDRDVPLRPKLLEALREYWRWKKPKDYLFPSTIGHRGLEKPLRPHRLEYLQRGRRSCRHPEKDWAAHSTTQFCHAPHGGRDRSTNHPVAPWTRTPGTYDRLFAPLASAPAYGD